MRFGIMTLQTAPYSAIADRWRRIEAMGFDSIWLPDHSSAQYPTLVSYDAWSLLAALAGLTSRVRLGTLVTSPTFQHPAVLALQATTVDHLSGGRLELGLGAGGARRDAASIGQPSPEPGALLDRFAEYLDALDRLLRGETLDFEGVYYRSSGAFVIPSVQRPRPPFTIAAQSKRGMALVARFADTWNTLGGQQVRSRAPLPLTLDAQLERTQAQAQLLATACAAIGRDPTTVRRSILAYRVGLFTSTEAFEEFARRYAELGFDECIAYWPADPETLEARPELELVMERVAADVLPRLRSEAGRSRPG